jgi:hypothetical protein
VLANEEVIGRAECKTIIRNKILLQKLWIFFNFRCFSGKLWNISLCSTMFPSHFISALVVAMISTKRVEDAILFAKEVNSHL